MYYHSNEFTAEPYFHVVLFIRLYELILTIESGFGLLLYSKLV